MKKKIFYLSLIMILMVLSTQATDHLKPVMEPYELMGKRLVFTNWFYVRTGHFEWQDEKGNKVNTEHDVMIDEHSAKFVPHDIASGIRIFSKSAKREIPLLHTDKPWDKWSISVSTLIHENGKYRLWGSSSSDKLNKMKSYFESNDGIHWEKPNLGIVEFEGSTDNNLWDVRFPPYSTGGPSYKESGISVFIDPSAPPEERYKTVWTSRVSYEEFQKKYRKQRPWSYYAIEKNNPGVEVDVLKGAVSAEGYTWKELPDPFNYRGNHEN